MEVQQSYHGVRGAGQREAKIGHNHGRLLMLIMPDSDGPELLGEHQRADSAD